MISELRSPELSKALRINPGTVGYRTPPTHFYTHSTCKLHPQSCSAHVKDTKYWFKKNLRKSLGWIANGTQTTHEHFRVPSAKTMTTKMTLILSIRKCVNMWMQRDERPSECWGNVFAALTCRKRWFQSLSQVRWSWVGQIPLLSPWLRVFFFFFS